MKAMAGVVGSVGEKKEDTGTRGYGDSLLAHSSADSSAGDGAWELCLCWSDPGDYSLLGLQATFQPPQSIVIPLRKQIEILITLFITENNQ